MKLHPITMYHGVWYATHRDTETAIKEQEKKSRLNWDAILFALIMIACLVIGGL